MGGSFCLLFALPDLLRGVLIRGKAVQFVESSGSLGPSTNNPMGLIAPFQGGACKNG